MAIYNTIKDILKDAISIAQKGQDLELTKKLMDVQQQVFGLQEENQKLKAKVEELEQKLAQKESLIIHTSGCLTRADISGIYYCPNCANKNEYVQMREVDVSRRRLVGGTHKCQDCKFAVTIS